MTSLEPLGFAVAVLVQLLGIASMFVARLSEESGSQKWTQPLFFACLASLGAVTIGAIACHAACWLSCGTTLAIMTVGATLDLKRTSCASNF